MAPIDIVEAEAEVARNQESVILAEAQLARAEDVLRTLILDPAAPDFWVVRLQPTDPPLLGPRPIDVDEAIRTAIARRTDIDQLRKQIENTDTNARFFANQRMPDVNLFVDYSVAGLGGRRFLRGPEFPGPVIGEQNYAFGDVLGDLLGNDFSVLAGRTDGRLSARPQHRRRQPRPDPARALAGRGPAAGDRGPRRHRGARRRPARDHQPAARRGDPHRARARPNAAWRPRSAGSRSPCRRASSSSRRNGTSPWRGTTSCWRPSTTSSRLSISKPCRKFPSSADSRATTV